MCESKTGRNHIKLDFPMNSIHIYNVLIEIRKFENQYMTLISENEKS